MLRLIFLTIILYIIIQHFMEDTDEKPTQIKSEDLGDSNLLDNINLPIAHNEKQTSSTDYIQSRIGLTGINNPPEILSEAKPLINVGQTNVENFAENNIQSQNNRPVGDNNEPRVMVFDKPNPWTKITIMPLEEFPYFFHVKVRIPSLNDFENWKQIIPNISFDPRAGELIIPSKDEPSALALCNLIVINLSGQLSLQNILEKNLIQISIAKAKSYEMVQNKLREQIMENLYGKQFNTVETNYERDLAKKRPERFTPNIERNTGRVDFKSETFSDTFEHFSDNSKKQNGIEAWDGNDYSYL